MLDIFVIISVANTVGKIFFDDYEGIGKKDLGSHFGALFFTLLHHFMITILKKIWIIFITA
jgi:hypothetical protein